ncbi:hypothetical protein Tco_0488791 [Tanacetum coccineum]
MADNRTMAQMFTSPIEGYVDAIVVPPINANNFELKQPLINLVQSNKFTGRQDPHNHLRFFNKSALDYRRGGNFREKMLEKFSHIRNKSQSALFRKLRLNSRASTNAPSSTSSPSNNSFEIQQMAALLEEKMNIWIDR